MLYSTKIRGKNNNLNKNQRLKLDNPEKAMDYSNQTPNPISKNISK
jgi:hypothetical protein